MSETWQRLALMVSDGGIAILNNSVVMVVGIGGVGAMACEALARSAIGTIILVDSDTVQRSNLNRQIHATVCTIGKKKVDVMAERIHSINPACTVVKHECHFDQSATWVFDNRIDYVIDAIDTISCKMDLIQMCHDKNIRVICCLGMGNRMDPSQLKYTQLSETSGDPLAKAMRIQARKRGIDYPIEVVFSTEQPFVQNKEIDREKVIRKDKFPPASSAFVPNAAGLLLASKVVRDLLEANSTDDLDEATHRFTD